MPRPNAPLLRPALALAVVLALAGCTTPDAGPDATEPPAASGTAAPTDTAAPTPEPTEEPLPFEAACADLITLDQMYEFNPNFGDAPGYEPESDAVSAVAEARGTVCGWSNQTSGDLIELGVATLPDNAYAAQVGRAAVDSTAVPTYGTPPDVEGFFSQSGGLGRAQVFAGGYWIVLESREFFEPGDAEQLVSAVRANLAGR
ncbi:MULTISPECIES: iron ABC transporter ATP-binding protein [unclassified Agromyces]|uniref:iron ABC transporter ATP-binding protein n=1 Tax=unclassified Agromyces TaxID=2639701 RepID=UPI0030155D17